MAYMIRADLEKLGITVNFNALEFNSLVGKLMSSYDWDAVIIGLTGGVEPHFSKNVWASSGQLHMWNPKQKTPATAWEKDIDDIFNAAGKETDQKKRKTLFDRWQQIVYEQQPLIFLVTPDSLYAVRNRLDNVRPNALARVAKWNVYEFSEK